MELLRTIATAGATAAVVVAGLTSAAAQSDFCLQLEARLVQIEQMSAAPGGDSRSYDASIGQQRNEIERAMAEARRSGCIGGFLIFQRQAEAKCPQLMGTIQEMRGNLTRLMRARSQSGGDPYLLVRERNDIRRELALNGCGYAGGGFQQQRPVGLFEALFGADRYSLDSGGFFGGQGFGAYRTLCVRTCDGYYFPISFSTLPAKFGADAATCQQMCPGTEATLYIHRNPGEDVTAMVSLDGQPYSAMPYAFRYRQQYDKACSCGSVASLVPQAEFSTGPLLLPPLDETVATEPSPPSPRFRAAAAGEDPETAANRRGRFDPAVVVPLPTTEELAGVTADGRPVRIVGPAPYYAP